jgi:two-component system, NtrC family, sensor kinase
MIADGYMNIGWVYHDKKDKFNESEYFNKALALYTETGNKQQIIDRYDDLREAFFLEGDVAKIFECAYAAQKIREQTGDKKTIADGFLHIASAFSNTGSKDLAEELKNDLSAPKLYKELGDNKGIGTMSFMIGGVYNNESKYAEALRILKDNGPLNEIANIYDLIGSAYEGQGDSAYGKGNMIFALGKYHEAENNQFISLKKWQAVPYRLSVANCYSAIGYLNIKLKNLNMAKKYLDSSLIIYQSLGGKGSVGYVYGGFAKIDSIKGNYRGAYDNYKLYKIYDDSSNNEEDAKKAVQVQMQYDFDKKEANSKAEQDKKDEETKRIKNTQYLVIGSLGILVLAILIIAFILKDYGLKTHRLFRMAKAIYMLAKAN